MSHTLSLESTELLQYIRELQEQIAILEHERTILMEFCDRLSLTSYQNLRLIPGKT